MTVGLKWWHAVCKEVREDGYGQGTRSRTYFIPADDSMQVSIVDSVQRHDDHYPAVHRPGLTEKQYQFLRTQWLAAYERGALEAQCLRNREAWDKARQA
jgi:hypothetical protein